MALLVTDQPRRLPSASVIAARCVLLHNSAADSAQARIQQDPQLQSLQQKRMQWFTPTRPYEAGHSHTRNPAATAPST